MRPWWYICLGLYLLAIDLPTVLYNYITQMYVILLMCKPYIIISLYISCLKPEAFIYIFACGSPVCTVSIYILTMPGYFTLRVLFLLCWNTGHRQPQKCTGPLIHTTFTKNAVLIAQAWATSIYIGLICYKQQKFPSAPQAIPRELAVVVCSYANIPRRYSICL